MIIPNIKENRVPKHHAIGNWKVWLRAWPSICMTWPLLGNQWNDPMVTPFQQGPWSLVTLSSGHLWPYYPRSLATLLSGHLRPYPFNNSHPPCVPLYHCLHSTSLFKLPPPCVPLNHCLHSTSLFKLPPPCVPLNHCHHYTSLFKLPPLRSTIPLSPFYFFI